MFEGVKDGPEAFDHSSEWFILDLDSGAVANTRILHMVRERKLDVFGPPANIHKNEIIFAARSQTAVNLYEAELNGSRVQVAPPFAN